MFKVTAFFRLKALPELYLVFVNAVSYTASFSPPSISTRMAQDFYSHSSVEEIQAIILKRKPFIIICFTVLLKKFAKFIVKLLTARNASKRIF